MTRRATLSAFSLVELAIVLVILGLLTGGVLTGQSLIRASELRSVTTDYQRYTAAVQTFRDKYFAMPGDMTNATAFWGKDNTYCSGHTGTAATPGTCNGDGDGQVRWGTAVNTTVEMFQFWKQLALAGLLEGNYTGIAGPGTSWPGADHVFATNCPTSKLSPGGWSGVKISTPSAGDAASYAGVYGGYFIFGASLTGNFPLVSILKPEELWNIDTKLDDGKPGTGIVLARDNGAFGSASNTCTTSTSQTDYSGTYSLTNTNVRCAAYFVRAF